MKSAVASAHSNIALVKYWGKRVVHGVVGTVDPALNLPAVGSLSMTLDRLRSVTTLREAAKDTFVLDGSEMGPKESGKVFEHLNLMWRARGQSGARPRVAVESTNHLPTAAGLASSASGFAALTMAAAAAFELDLSDRGRLSSLARCGSGSAARSIWGGFVRLDAGVAADGSDCIAAPIFTADHWDLRLIVVQTTKGAKAVASTGGMELCRETSPYYEAWVNTHLADLDEAHAALHARELSRLGPVVERSCFKMHASMLATSPPLVYWNGTTLEVIRALWDARREGKIGYATSDAGPHVKVLCEAASADALCDVLRAVPGVVDVEALAPGPDASVEVLS